MPHVVHHADHRMQIGVTGHQALPPTTRKLVDQALRAILTRWGPKVVGITCLADGADQLFAQAVLAQGGALWVIVPATQYRDGFDNPDAQRAYDDLIAKAERTEQLAHVESTEEAHMAGGKAVVDRSEVLLAVWDGAPARGLGGTADVVAYARERSTPVEVIWPDGCSRS
jgi:hypothetical protein